MPQIIIGTKYNLKSHIPDKFTGEGNPSWRIFFSNWKVALLEMQRSGYGPVQYYKELLKATGGFAHSLIAEFALDSDVSYFAAIEILVNEFERDDRLIDEARSEFTKMKKCASNYTDMTAFRGMLHRYRMSVERIGATPDIMQFAFELDQIQRSMCKEQLAEWQKVKATKRNRNHPLGYEVTWGDLMKALEDAAETKKAFEDRFGGGQQQQQRDKKQSFATGNAKTGTAKDGNTKALATPAGQKGNTPKGSDGQQQKKGQGKNPSNSNQQNRGAKNAQSGGGGGGRGGSQGGSTYAVDNKTVLVPCAGCQSPDGLQYCKHAYPRQCPWSTDPEKLRTFRHNVKYRGGCTNCYAKGHAADQCPVAAKLKCSVQGCKGQHGKVFHDDEATGTRKQASNAAPQRQQQQQRQQPSGGQQVNQLALPAPGATGGDEGYSDSAYSYY